MAFSKQVTLDKIEILPDGTIQVRTKISVFEDTNEIGFQYNRTVFVPGDDVSTQPARLKALCNFVWTPAVVAAYQAAHAVSQLPQIP